MSILETILGRKNKGPVPVATPEWPELDGQLSIRKLTPAERTAFYTVASEEKPKPGVEFLTLAAVYCTLHDGKRAFENHEWSALVTDPGSGSAIERLAEVADEVNVLSDGARDALKKKSEPAPVCDSNCASPESSGSPSTNC